jgi:hypothetical protein
MRRASKYVPSASSIHAFSRGSGAAKRLRDLRLKDFNGEGMSDLLWRDTSGDTSIWFMNGTAVSSIGAVGNIPTTWTVQSANAG